MRFILCAFLASFVLLVQGCALTPGKSPAQIQAEYSSAGYVDRGFNDMHPDIP